jgi:hypothetical protein
VGTADPTSYRRSNRSPSRPDAAATSTPNKDGPTGLTDLHDRDDGIIAARADGYAAAATPPTPVAPGRPYPLDASSPDHRG